MPRSDFRFGLVLLAGCALAVPARADACTVSATGVGFGAYDPSGASPDDGVGAISVTCHPNVQAPEVALEAGTSGQFATRTMVSGAATMDYNLYTDSARNVVWGNGTGGSVTVTLSGGTVNAGDRRYSRSVYGRITQQQNVPAGSYGDTVMVTVIF